LQHRQVDSEEPTYEQLRAFYIAYKGQCGGGVVDFHFAQSHEGRILALETILEYSYNGFVRNRHLKQDQSEDALTVEIVEQLRSFEIEASHDTQVGGHCDVHVIGKDHFLWLAEAKIHSSYDWLEQGFRQLSTRFGVSVHGQDHGEIIIYCRTKLAAKILAEWKDRLTAAHDDVKVYEDMIGTRLWFRSSHPCQSTGNSFFTRHRIIPLYWNPDDKR
jgi:hypothetical protein